MQNRIIEEASDEGNNCVFNAFLLGLCQPHVLDSLNVANPEVDLKDFVTAVAPAFNKDVRTFTWAELKKQLIACKKQNPQTFQAVLGKIMRQFALDLAKKDALFADSMIPALQNTFEQHIANTNSQDDIFLRHEFIKKKFNELKNSSELLTLENKVEALNNWWHAEGCDAFLNAMGDKGYLAGDLELGQLARYFGVNLTIDVQNTDNPFTYAVVEEHGFLGWHPQYDELVTRNVIDVNSRLLKMSEFEVKAKINGINNEGQIFSLWQKAYKNPPLIQLQLVNKPGTGPHYNHVIGAAPKMAASNVPPQPVKQTVNNPPASGIPTVNFPPKQSQQPANASAPPPAKVAHKQSAPKPKASTPPSSPVVGSTATKEPLFLPTNTNPDTKSPVVPKPVKVQPANANEVAKPSELIRETISFFEGLRQKCGTSYNNAVSDLKSVKDLDKELEDLDKELMAAWVKVSGLNATEYKVPDSLNVVKKSRYLAQMKEDRELAIKLQIEEIEQANKPPRKR